MKKILNTIGLMSLGIVALIALTVGGMFLTQGSAFAFGNGNRYVPANDQDYPDDRPGCAETDWEDYDDSELKNKERLKNRPGNLELVRVTGEVLEGIWAVEPNFPHVAYPFNNNGKLFETFEDHKEYDEKEAQNKRDNGRALKNKARKYNLNISRLQFVNFAENELEIGDPEAIGVSEHKAKRFSEIRQHHKERCVLVLQYGGVESLRSDKVEGGPDDLGFYFCWVLKDDSWKLVWFEK